MTSSTATARLWLRAKQIALVTALLILQACGGGGGGTDTAADATAHLYDSFGRDVLSGGGGGFDRSDSGADGSGGDGAPIAFADVVITGLTGTPVPTKTDAQGYYRAKVTGLTAPLLVTLTKPDGSGKRYSLSMAALQPGKFVTINISGLTTQIASDVAVALGKTGAADLTPELLNSNPALVTATIDASLAGQKTLLATVMGAAGVSTSTYNPISTPFVTDHTGYDYLLDNTVVTVPPTGATTTTPLAAFNPIVGAWSLTGSSLGVVFTFSADGHYTMGQAAVGSNAVALQVWPGLEYGVYSYNSTTGDLNFACPLVDTNGTAGTSGDYTGGFNDAGVPVGTCISTPTRSAVVSGNTVTITNTGNASVNTFTRIADSTNALVGSWSLVDATLSAQATFTFTADGHYMYAQPVVTGSATTNQVWPGIEYGTYTWSAATGALSFGCPQVDTNGTAGTQGSYASFTDGLISNGHTPVGTAGGGQPSSPCPAAALNATLAITGNSMTATFPLGGTKTLNRVVYGVGSTATASALYGLSIKASIRRSQDLFPGNLSRFTSGMSINIDNSVSGGASPSTYDSVRVTGTGLPTTGLWYVRTASAGAFSITTVRSATPQTTAALTQAIACPGCSSFWFSRTLDISGPNASVLDANPTLTPQWASATDGSYTGATGVRPTLGTVYTFEIYKDATLVTTETRTLQSNLVPAEQAVNLAWNDLGTQSLAALDVTNTALNGIQNTLLVDWIKKPLAEPIKYVWVSQTNGDSDNATSFLPTATSVLATPFTADGSITQFTGMAGTTNYNGPVYGGYRELGFNYLMSDGSAKSAVYVYYP